MHWTFLVSSGRSQVSTHVTELFIQEQFFILALKRFYNAWASFNRALAANTQKKDVDVLLSTMFIIAPSPFDVSKPNVPV